MIDAERLLTEMTFVALFDPPLVARFRDRLVGPLYCWADRVAGLETGDDAGDYAGAPIRARVAAVVAFRLDIAGAAAITRRARRNLSAVQGEGS